MAGNSASPAGPVTIGAVIGVHGVAGQLRVRVLSDVPGRFDPGQVVHISDAPYLITFSARLPRDQARIQLQGIDSVVAAQPLVGQWLTAPQPATAPLPEGDYFHYQLIGLRVVTEEGEELGQVAEILETGSNDVYLVSGPQGEVLIPALAQVVRQVDLKEGTMLVRLMEGLR